METLTLNDGTVLENSHAIENNDRLFIYVENGSTISQVFDIQSKGISGGITSKK